MVYSEARRLWVLSSEQFRTILNALKTEPDHGSTSAVFCQLLKEDMSEADLCRAHGISRPTAYRWINRYSEMAPEGLVDRSRRPHSWSNATLEPIVNAIPALRAKPRLWGTKAQGTIGNVTTRSGVACASTFGNSLSRFGLTSPKKRRKRTTPV